MWADWSRRGVAWFESLGADSVAVDVIDRDTADDPDLVADIESADLVYLSGGKPTLLHRILDGSAAWRAIEAVLARGGILAGCSAGAMVQGERIAGLRRASQATPGFGLLPHAVVLPHFDEYPSMIGAAVSRLVGRGLSVVGVDGGTALVRHQRRAARRGSRVGDRVGPVGPPRLLRRGAPRRHDRTDQRHNFLIRPPRLQELAYSAENNSRCRSGRPVFQGERWAAHTAVGDDRPGVATPARRSSSSRSSSRSSSSFCWAPLLAASPFRRKNSVQTGCAREPGSARSIRSMTETEYDGGHSRLLDRCLRSDRSGRARVISMTAWQRSSSALVHRQLEQQVHED